MSSFTTSDLTTHSMLSSFIIRNALATCAIGRSLHCVETIGSTNETLKQWLTETNAPHGTVLCTEFQTAGHGRHARSWHSTAGLNLMFSLLLRPDGTSPVRYPQLTMLAAISLCKTLENLSALAPALQSGHCSLGLKWPNDLWLDARKVSGILCENVTGPNPGIIIGIGLNVNAEYNDFPQELHAIATSLRIAAGSGPIPREPLLASFLNGFEADYLAWLDAPDTQNLPEWITRFWNCHDILKNHPITVCDRGESISGMADGIAPNGFLKLRLPDNTIRIISAGDVHIQKRQRTI